MIENISENTCIIVPTIALLNELSNKVRLKFNATKTITKSNITYNTKNIYVFTPEKYINFISFNKNNKIKFNFFTVDEAHNLLSNNSRSFILEYVIKHAYHNTNKLILLTPKTKKKFFKNHLEKNLYDKLEFIKLDNRFITQRIIYKIIKNNVYYWSFLKNKFIKLIVNFELKFELIVKSLNEKPIIYCPKNRMFEYAEKIKNNEINLEKIKFLLQYYEENIGTEYEIYDILKNGVLIHNGEIDKTSRLLIENLFRNNDNLPLLANQSFLV